jgi:SAM-dependent MidA family methyltransferase
MSEPRTASPLSTLPEPPDDAKLASRALAALIGAEIDTGGGWMSFSRYMELALHHPGLGYYGGGSRKFGDSGDFVTAPELTPLFGQTLAAQVAQIMGLSSATILEVGAGSGRLAADLLLALERQGRPVRRYLILELSGELRSRQQATIADLAPQFADCVEWLDHLPERFIGCVVANEVLDAMPVHALAWRPGGLMERGVSRSGDSFGWREQPAPRWLETLAGELPVAGTMESEIGLAARSWVAEWGQRLDLGALLLIDYGLPRHEYYYAGRSRGTLRCHYRHRSHDDPFWWPGLCDITTHVDFTAVAEAAHGAGLDVLGYTTQANFLVNCGLGHHLAVRKEEDGASALRAAGAVQVLVSANEMGEQFKVIALGRGLREPLMGFVRGDRTHTL